MSSASYLGTTPRLIRGVLLLSAAILTGCGRGDIQVYRVAKETQNVDKQQPDGHQHAAGERALPGLAWTLPGGNWEEATPGEMRLASFRVKGQSGQTADVGVFPLPGMAGSDLSNVNRWRGQVGLAAIDEQELGKIGQTVRIDGLDAKLYDLAGENAGSGEKTRILAALLRREGVAWFFKMTGDDALVAAEKGAFIKLLESMKFQKAGGRPELPPDHPPIGGSAVAGATDAAPSADRSKPTWTTPSGWKEVAAGQFLVAKFALDGDNNTHAAVNVSMSAGDGGGLSGNVNRWRRQIGLPEAAEDQLGITTLTLSDGSASLVDMVGTDPRTGGKTRTVGAMVPRKGQTWFYKLMGDESLVGREKEAFLKFIQSAKYPNAS